MRTRYFIIAALILSILSTSPTVKGQVPMHPVVLYAHSFGESAILNGLAQWSGQKAADISRGITFRLTPVLGERLRINGGVTFVLYLRAGFSFFGSVEAQISEVGRGGVERAVPGARVDTPLNLDTRTVLITLGVGIIDFEFQSGSSIMLHVGVVQGSASGTPFLVWDDSSSPTSVRLPVVSSSRIDLSFGSLASYGTVLQASSRGSQVVNLRAIVHDAIGVYRFPSASFQLTASNGTVTTAQVNVSNNTDYSGLYSTTVTLDQGRWDVNFVMRDLTGEVYRAVGNLWVAPFYPVMINVVGSDGSLLENASLQVSFRNDANWRSPTNATGWGFLTLPSSQIVGALNLTVAWLGTETVSSLDIVGASTFLLKVPVHDFAIRVTMNGLAVPAAQVTLMEKGVVQGRYTGLDGVANFRTIPTGNYTLRVGYMFATYESRLNVKGDGVMAVAVPLPHRTVILVGLITAACASIMIIRKRRLRLYPQTFAYFRELTRGGLPEACFTVISGDSGSGKSVLLNSIAGEHLAVGRGVYVTNIEFPDKIRESMVRLGVCGEDEVKSDRLLFIDAYSAIGGESSRAEYYVASHTDLTGLGLNISRCLERVGRGGDVYFDSLNALVTVLRIDYLLNFLQSIAAKVKLNGGKFCVTIGGGVEKADLAKLEEISDCMIETQVQETGRGQRRRLRIKKLRDKPYIDRWTRFRVEQGRGVVFLTPAKPKP